MAAGMAPGFRFYPTEEELVSFYLHNKLENKRQEVSRVIPAINIYEVEPCQLPKLSGELCVGDREQWFFFVPRQEREARGGRPNRTTASGYWKATGSPSYVYSSDNRVIGVKKSMVFYKGKAPTGRKTKWKLHEYRAIEQAAVPSASTTSSVPMLRHEMSLCRLYVVSGSFRAFDRRPVAAATGEGSVQNTSDGEGLAFPSQDGIKLETKSSPESSIAEGDNLETDTENWDNPLWEALRDWEQIISSLE